MIILYMSPALFLCIFLNMSVCPWQGISKRLANDAVVALVEYTEFGDPKELVRRRRLWWFFFGGYCADVEFLSGDLLFQVISK